MKWTSRLLGAVVFFWLAWSVSITIGAVSCDNPEPEYVHAMSLSWEQEGRIVVH